MNRFIFRCFLLIFFTFFSGILLYGVVMLVFENDEFGYYNLPPYDRPLDSSFHDSNRYDLHHSEAEALHEDIPHPIILWWYRFTGEQTIRSCGDVKCFITNDRHYFNHPSMKVLMFYGTHFDTRDLPFPRAAHHEWGLLHEESPKNVFHFSHPEIMELFNHTATFKRESHYPVTTMWLKDIASIETRSYLLSTEKKNSFLSDLAPVTYVHSDCDTPSDRDHFVEMLQQHGVKVDSYGKCQHNRDLPENLRDPIDAMFHDDFLRLMARYKFAIVAENAVCDDYVTEKLWRTLTVGSVPIIIGSSKIRDYLPDNHSAILVDDFHSTADLAALINHLNHDDDDYNAYLAYKVHGVTNQHLLDVMSQREWGTDNPRDRPNFVSGTECFVCRRVHENLQRQARGETPHARRADVTHYGCPKPLAFRGGASTNDLERVEDQYLSYEWVRTRYEAQALKEFWSRGSYNFTDNDLAKRMTQLRYEAGDV